MTTAKVGTSSPAKDLNPDLMILKRSLMGLRGRKSKAYLQMYCHNKKLMCWHLPLVGSFYQPRSERTLGNKVILNAALWENAASLFGYVLLLQIIPRFLLFS